MKQWFPLTDYDFYAYLISGMLLIAAVDYAFAGGGLVYRTQWTVAEGLFWVTIAYLVGQVLAAPSAAVLEHLVARRWMHTPADVQLGLKNRSAFERYFAAVFAPREYAPLTSLVRTKALELAGARGGEASGNVTGEAVFQAAFHPARQFPDTVNRLSIFLNQYGFSRNVAFSSFLACMLLTVRNFEDPSRETSFLVIATALLSIGMFGRFIKFYAAYSADVLRSYATLVNE